MFPKACVLAAWFSDSGNTLGGDTKFRKTFVCLLWGKGECICF